MDPEIYTAFVTIETRLVQSQETLEKIQNTLQSVIQNQQTIANAVTRLGGAPH